MSEELSISAAVQRYEVSRKTVRRRLAEGAIEGAHQRPGDHGPEWVFPASSLEALGYRARGEPVSGADPDAGVDDNAGRATAAVVAGERQFDAPSEQSTDSSDRRRMAGIWVLLALIFGPLLGFLLATVMQGDDDDPKPLTAVLAELTEPGDEIGVVEPVDAALPADRIAVPIDDLDLAGAGSPTRYVVIGIDGPIETLDALKESTRAVLALDQAADPVWIFDTEADPVLVSATSVAPTTAPVDTTPTSGPPATESPETTTAPSTTEAPTTSAPATTVAPTTTAPDADPAPSVDGEGGPSTQPDDESGVEVRGTVTVQDGEHFWSIAEDVVTQQLGETPTDAQVTSYWAQLIDANVDQLVDPGNPDLLLPGQVLQLPSL